MLEVSNDVVGTIENMFRMGRVNKGTHNCKYRFFYIENGNSHECSMTESTDGESYNRVISMGTIKFGWDNSSGWSIKDYNLDKEYFKIFLNMLKCLEKELEIKLPETIFK